MYFNELKSIVSLFVKLVQVQQVPVLYSDFYLPFLLNLKVFQYSGVKNSVYATLQQLTELKSMKYLN